ncbi:substrate-binding domain-containing protein [Streptomyces sp. CC224E]|uniref:substrate-binding domain-containing protein n=2 Tax=unclassified Streptomyces TaxID=2593676 RepID=UPI00278C0738|nr:substrate-binding domain-containing protein [Streptomyces sp. CC224E]
MVDEMESALNPAGEIEGRVSVGASALLLETRVGELVRECRRRYPKVHVSPRALDIARAADTVRDGGADLVLVHGDCAPANQAGIVVDELPGLEVVPVGPASLARAADPSLALAGLPVLAVDPDCDSHHVLVSALRELHGLDPQVVEAGSVGGARELVRVGYGIAMLPAESVRSATGADGMAVIPGLPRVRLGARLLWLGPERSLSAVSAVSAVATRQSRQLVPQAA